MKLLTKEQEQAHYNETLKGGAIGGLSGLAIGTVGVLGASRRYPFFRSLTLPLKAFLITSAGTFGGIVYADHYSRSYEKAVNPIDQEYAAREKQRHQQEIAGKSFTQRALDWGKQERYKIVGVSWLASMATAFALVNRNKFLTGQQKLVQARVYAQFLTLGVLIASAAFELSDKQNETGRYETRRIVDPSDPEHKRMIEKQYEVPAADSGDELWKDMVAAEEQRLKEREDDEKRLRSKHKKSSSNGDGGSKKKASEKKDEKKSQGDDDEKKEEGDDSGKEEKKKDSGKKK